MKPLLPLWLALLLVLGGCASPLSRVVLLPSADGTPSAVTVTPRGAAQQVIERPYGALDVAADGTVQPRQLDPAAVGQAYQPVLDALPPPPRSYQLYFRTGGTVLAPGSEEAMAQMLAEVAARVAPEVDVIGHTDSVGSVAQNDALGRQRAESVATLLVGRGIARERISVQSRGERELLVPTPDETEESRNRRVEVRVR